MQAGQKLKDERGRQVALFPLPYITISQADDETFSHEDWYYATDYLGWNESGRVYRCPCYAPVDIKCIFIDRSECLAVWESLEKVHLANGIIDYLGIIVYHDNDVEDGITQIGTIKRQGEEFNKTGTGAYITGDHIHLETGYGRYTQPSISTPRGTSNYKYHFTDYTDVKRLHNYDALFSNNTVIYISPSYYVWKNYIPSYRRLKGKNTFPWVLYARKLRDK